MVFLRAGCWLPMALPWPVTALLGPGDSGRRPTHELGFGSPSGLSCDCSPGPLTSGWVGIVAVGSMAAEGASCPSPTALWDALCHPPQVCSVLKPSQVAYRSSRVQGEWAWNQVPLVPGIEPASDPWPPCTPFVVPALVKAALTSHANFVSLESWPRVHKCLSLGQEEVTFQKKGILVFTGQGWHSRRAGPLWAERRAMPRGRGP